MAERIVNEIIFETAKASKAIAGISKKLQGYTKDLLLVAKAEDKASKDAEKARVFFDKLSGTTRKAAQTQKELTAATNSATAASRRNTDQVKKQKKSADDLGISWTTVKRIFAGQIIFRALSALTNQMRDSVGVAKELGIKLAEAITIAPGTLSLTTEGVARLGSEVRELSESFGVDQIELATAAYQVYSNQIGNAAESTEFLRTAVLFAKATVTDTANAVDLLSGVINSYGLEAAEAARISDIFTKAVELGRFRIDDIANSMGRVNPIAAQLGIRIEEVAAAFSTLTIKGVSPDKAMTQLLAVMLKMVKPSNALTKALNEIGFTSIKMATSTLGLVGTLKALVDTTDGTVEALGRLFPRVRSIQGVLGLVGDEGKRFNSIFKEIQDTAEGTTKKFAAFILATDSEEFERNIQAIKNFFVDEFGKSFIKTVNNVLEAMGGIPGAVNKIQSAVEILAVAFTGLLLRQVTVGFFALKAQITGTAFAASGLTAALFRIPFAVLAIGAAAAGQALAVLIDQFILGGFEADRMANRQKALGEATKELATTIANSAGLGLDAVRDAANKQLDAVVDSIRAQIIAYEEQGNRIKFLGQEVTDDLVSELDRRVDAFEEFADGATNALERAAKESERIDTKISRIRSRSEQALFDQGIRHLSKIAQRRKKDARALDLIRRANVTTSVEERNELLKTAEAQAKGGRFAKIATDARIKGLEQEKTELQKAAVILDRLAPTINKAVAEMKRLTDEAKKWGEELGKAVEKLDFNAALKASDKLGDAFKKLEKEQKDIEGVIGREFGKSLTGLREGLGNLFSDPLTISLKFENLTKELNELFRERKVPVSIIIKAGQLGIDTKDATFESILKGLGFARDDMEKGFNQIKGRLVVGVSRTLEEAKSEIESLLTEKKAVFAGGVGVLVPSVSKEVAFTLEILEKELDLIREILSVGKGEKITLEQFERLGKIIGFIRPEIEQLRTQGFDKLGESFDKLEGKIEAIESKLNRAKGISELDEDTKAYIKSILEMNQKAPKAAEELQKLSNKAFDAALNAAALGQATLDIGPAAQTGASQAVSALQTIGSTASSQKEGVRSLAAELRALAVARQGAAIVTEATGGQIPAFLAAGGPTQSRGTDTVPVQAAPGEFFVNAASSRRFIPELTAINQGRAPEPRNNSQITNNSFSGDININVPPGTKVDGRTITQDIRRELRRKTSSLS